MLTSKEAQPRIRTVLHFAARKSAPTEGEIKDAERVTPASERPGRRRRFKGGGELRYSTRTFLTPSGRELEGAGVTPDTAVALTLADLRAGRDAALEEAESLLRGKQ